MALNRRSFLKNSSLGAAGIVAGSTIIPKSAVAAHAGLPKSKVSFRGGGTNRRQMVLDVLEPIKAEIEAAIANKQIIIKPNIVTWGIPLAATHVDAVRGLLDFLSSRTTQKIIIADSTYSPNPSDSALVGFTSYGYDALTSEYNVQLVDLNTVTQTNISGILIPKVAGAPISNSTETTIQVASYFTNSNNYVISINRPKTHNYVVATLTMKNLLMGAPAAKTSLTDKCKMHGGLAGSQTTQYGTSEYLSNNLKTLAHHFIPDLAIIDGLEGMQGEGPVNGSAVNHGVAVASTDPIAADFIGLHLMGINPDYVAFLKWLGNEGMGNYNLSGIDLVGPDTDIDAHIIKYQLPANLQSQIGWIASASQRPDYLNPVPHLELAAARIIRGRELRIRFSLPVAFPVELAVYNSRGQEIRRLISDHFAPGSYSVNWDGTDGRGAGIPAGQYIVTLKTDRNTVSRNLTAGF